MINQPILSCFTVTIRYQSLRLLWYFLFIYSFDSKPVAPGTSYPSSTCPHVQMINLANSFAFHDSYIISIIHSPTMLPVLSLQTRRTYHTIPPHINHAQMINLTNSFWLLDYYTISTLHSPTILPVRCLPFQTHRSYHPLPPHLHHAQMCPGGRVEAAARQQNRPSRRHHSWVEEDWEGYGRNTVIINWITMQDSAYN